MKHQRIRLYAIGIYLLFAACAFLPRPSEPPPDTWIIAHRGGGSGRAENSLEGISYAIEMGCDACEVDVQRTMDGYYIIHHDKTFSRTARLDQSPGDMTLSEIKSLRIASSGVDEAGIPTLEEALDAAKGNIRLLIELKGSSADKKMADDVAAMLRDRDMLEEAMVLAFDYKLVRYLERKCPAIVTGYLCTKAPRAPAYLRCDCLLVQEAALTDQAIWEIHQAGKRALVWTVNSGDALRRFLAGDVDGIITDSVALALGERDSVRLADRAPQ